MVCPIVITSTKINATYLSINPIILSTQLLAQMVIDLAHAVLTITMVERVSASEGMVAFEPQSLGVFDVKYYIASDTSTPGPLNLVYVLSLIHI